MSYSSYNLIAKSISIASKTSIFSDFDDNHRYLTYKYGIGIQKTQQKQLKLLFNILQFLERILALNIYICLLLKMKMLC